MHSELDSRRLGIFVDVPYHVTGSDDDRSVTTVAPFMRFACEVASGFERAVLIGRTAHDRPPKQVPLLNPPPIIELPYYGNLRELGPFLRGLPIAIWRIWRAVGTLDIVWVFAGGPMALVVAVLARVRRRRVVVGVRQQTDQYWRHRLRGRRERIALGPALALARLTDLVTRGCDRTVVGATLAAEAPGGGRVLDMTILLATSDQLAHEPRPTATASPTTLLTVGRIDQEKNPLLLVEAVAELERRHPGRFRLIWVGGGRLEGEVRAAVAANDLDRAVEFRGYVAFGDELLELYRQADLFVHVSLTEGVPQVLLEAMACATPIVATAVGGVAVAVEDGAAALLIPGADCAALVAAIDAVFADPAATERRVRRGLAIASRHALDVEAQRVARFLAD